MSATITLSLSLPGLDEEKRGFLLYSSFTKAFACLINTPNNCLKVTQTRSKNLKGFVMLNLLTHIHKSITPPYMSDNTRL